MRIKWANCRIGFAIIVYPSTLGVISAHRVFLAPAGCRGVVINNLLTPCIKLLTPGVYSMGTLCHVILVWGQYGGLLEKTLESTKEIVHLNMQYSERHLVLFLHYIMTNMKFVCDKHNTKRQSFFLLPQKNSQICHFLCQWLRFASPIGNMLSHHIISRSINELTLLFETLF